MTHQSSLLTEHFRRRGPRRRRRTSQSSFFLLLLKGYHAASAARTSTAPTSASGCVCTIALARASCTVLAWTWTGTWSQNATCTTRAGARWRRSASSWTSRLRTCCANRTCQPVVKSKIQEKQTKYVTSGMIAADVFRVGVMYSTGGCDAGMMDFLSQFTI